ncbi:MAG TPA: hypothetical protein VGE43_04620 [Acidimicrobiales bacterium]
MLALALTGLVLVPTSTAAGAAEDRRCGRTNDSVRKLLECVTVDGVLEHERAFQAIADAALRAR